MNANLNNRKSLKGKLISAVLGFVVAGASFATPARAIEPGPSYDGLIGNVGGGDGTGRARVAQPVQPVQPTQPTQGQATVHIYQIERLCVFVDKFARLNDAYQYINYYQSKGLTAQLSQEYFIDGFGRTHVTQLVYHWEWRYSQQATDVQSAYLYLGYERQAGNTARVVHLYQLPTPRNFGLFLSDYQPRWETPEVMNW